MSLRRKPFENIMGKEKMLVTPFPTMFSTPTKKKNLVSRINPFPSKPWFLCVCSTCLLKTSSNFSFFYSVFYKFREVSAIFIKTEFVVSKLFLFWKSLKSDVWERVKIVFCTSFQSGKLSTVRKRAPFEPKLQQINLLLFENYALSQLFTKRQKL